MREPYNPSGRSMPREITTKQKKGVYNRKSDIILIYA